MQSTSQMQQALKQIDPNDLTFTQKNMIRDDKAIHKAQWQDNPVIVKEFIVDPRDRSFSAELEYSTTLKHKNILHSLGRSEIPNGHVFHPTYHALVYPYIVRESLDKHATDKFPWPKKIKIALQIATALAHIHGRDLIYCDLKSENVLLDHNNDAILADLEMIRPATAPGGMRGTPPYWPGECWGMNDKNNKMTDTYAFGMFLLELILGPRQFEFSFLGRSTNDVWEEHRSGYARMRIQRKLDAIASTTPSALLQIIEDCLNQNPKKRPAMPEIVRQLTALSKETNLFKTFSKTTHYGLVYGGAILGFCLFGPGGAALGSIAGALVPDTVEALTNKYKSS